MQPTESRDDARCLKTAIQPNRFPYSLSSFFFLIILLPPPPPLTTTLMYLPNGKLSRHSPNSSGRIGLQWSLEKVTHPNVVYLVESELAVPEPTDEGYVELRLEMPDFAKDWSDEQSAGMCVSITWSLGLFKGNSDAS